MSTANNELVSVKEMDYLEQDDPIRGQNYVCLSFVSPEDAIKAKEVFFFHRFLGSFSKDLGEFFDSIKDRFKDDETVVNMVSGLRDRYDYLFNDNNLQHEYEHFKEEKSSSLEAEYFEKNNFQTSIRGIKVRGTYETLPEATRRAEQIKKKDPAFHVYVAQVGCWCPWSPYPEHVQDQEYSETQLNSLMKKYKEGQEVKEELYRMRKEEMAKAKKAAANATEGSSQVMEEEDPWIAQKEKEASSA